MNNTAIKSLHADLLTCWNRRDAKGMAALMQSNASMVGFDGSQINGATEIEAELSRIFANHQTAPFIWKVEEVRPLTDTCALLRAIVGMIPPGSSTLNPATNAIQSMIAVKETKNSAQETETWKIALFQNTPAQFHGRPELVEKMTRELSQLIPGKSSF